MGIDFSCRWETSSRSNVFENRVSARSPEKTLGMRCPEEFMYEHVLGAAWAGDDRSEVIAQPTPATARVNIIAVLREDIIVPPSRCLC